MIWWTVAVTTNQSTGLMEYLELFLELFLLLLLLDNRLDIIPVSLSLLFMLICLLGQDHTVVLDEVLRLYEEILFNEQWLGHHLLLLLLPFALLINYEGKMVPTSHSQAGWVGAQRLPSRVPSSKILSQEMYLLDLKDVSMLVCNHLHSLDPLLVIPHLSQTIPFIEFRVQHLLFILLHEGLLMIDELLLLVRGRLDFVLIVS